MAKHAIASNRQILSLKTCRINCCRRRLQKRKLPATSQGLYRWQVRLSQRGTESIAERRATENTRERLQEASEDGKYLPASIEKRKGNQNG